MDIHIARKLLSVFVVLAITSVLHIDAYASDGFRIEEATWNDEYNRLKVKGKGDERKTITLSNADTGEVLATKYLRDNEWRIRLYDLDNVPCRVRVEQSNGESDEADVKYAPHDCDNGGGNPPGGGDPGFADQTDFKIMMNYELGMHCTGFEFAYCCVLPAYNSILAQVVKPEGTDGADFPELLEGDPAEGLDALGRQTVVRDKSLDNGGQFKKYVLRYWHEAQPRNDGRGKAQSSLLISAVEGNSLMSWNTTFDSAALNPDGSFVTGAYNGSDGVVLGDGDTTDPSDNYQNGVWNHLYFYEDLEGSNSTGTSLEADKIRLGVNGHVVYPTDCGPALHPMGPVTTDPLDPNNTVPNDCGGFSKFCLRQDRFRAFRRHGSISMLPGWSTAV